MAENDNAVLTAAVGYVYVGPVGTAAPTPAALKTINLDSTSGWGSGLTVWSPVGHTSRGNLPEFGFDGGKEEVRGSWQKKKLREVVSEEPVDYLTVNLLQFDEDALSLYYGDNASSTTGVFAYSGSSGTNEKAGLVIIEDGTLRVGFHFSKASVKRDDKIELPIDDLASLPVKFTFLNHSTNPLFSWINEDLFNPAVGP